MEIAISNLKSIQNEQVMPEHIYPFEYVPVRDEVIECAKLILTDLSGFSEPVREPVIKIEPSGRMWMVWSWEEFGPRKHFVECSMFYDSFNDDVEVRIWARSRGYETDMQDQAAHTPHIAALMLYAVYLNLEVAKGFNW